MAPCGAGEASGDDLVTRDQAVLTLGQRGENWIDRVHGPI